MAARGHVQDPNDRRLRPIYGEHSMGSCTLVHIWMCVECLWNFTMLPLRGLSGCYESRGGGEGCTAAAASSPTTVSAACSAQWQCTLAGLAGVRHGSQGLLLKIVCLAIWLVITRSGLRTLNVPHSRLTVNASPWSTVANALCLTVSMLTPEPDMLLVLSVRERRWGKKFQYCLCSSTSVWQYTLSEVRIRWRCPVRKEYWG